MASTTKSRLAENTRSNISTNRFNTRHFTKINTAQLNSLNIPRDTDRVNVNVRDDDNLEQTNSGRGTQENCSFHNIEKAINIAYNKKKPYSKSLKTIQLTVMKNKQPCLFDMAHIFGGSECSSINFNGLCTFHWSMLNLTVSLCDGYNSVLQQNVKFQHYEMLIEKVIPERSFIPIFPYIDEKTEVFDLIFGFMYATTKGLETTKKNEGVAMAYTLYYMINSNCRYDWLMRSAYWIDSMTTYLMSSIVYNEKLIRSGLVHNSINDMEMSRPEFIDKGNIYPSVLQRFFVKDIASKKININTNKPIMNKLDGKTINTNRLASVTPPLQSDSMDIDAPIESSQINNSIDEWEYIPYYKMSIFVAPIILSLRPSTYIFDNGEYASPPLISLFDMTFKDNKNVRAFAIQGPVLYGVSDIKTNRGLPFTNNLPICTQTYVATLASSSNIEPQEDRIFASSTAKQVKLTFNEIDNKRILLPGSQVLNENV